MFKPTQFRTRAGEYGDLANTSNGLEKRRAFRKLEQKFATLADNEQWLADNFKNVVPADRDRSTVTALASEEEFILRCLGAALIMQWNALPAKLQRELFDNAGAMGELLNTSALRGQIARFLHKHKNDEDARTGTINADGDADIAAAAIARWDDEGGASRGLNDETRAGQPTVPPAGNRLSMMTIVRKS